MGTAAILSDPVRQRPLANTPPFDQTDAARALDLAAQVLLVIVEPRQARFVFDARVRAFGRGFLDRVDPLVEHRHHRRILPAEGVLHLGQRGVARGRSGIARRHDEIAILEARAAHLQVMFGLERHVVRRIVRSRPVGRDIGAIEGEIAGVARPHPVIDIAAIFPDRIRRRIDEAHVAHFEALDKLVLVPAIEARDEATIASVLLAFGSDVLHALLDRVVTRIGRKALGPRAHPLGHVAFRDRHIDARARCGLQFGALGLGEEAVLEIIVLGGGIVLHRSARAVMVRHHEPFGRNEAGRTAAERDDRAHREAGEVAQGLGRDFETGLAQVGGDLGQLVGRVHAFLGGGGHGDGGGAGEQGGGGDVSTHDVDRFLSPARVEARPAAWARPIAGVLQASLSASDLSTLPGSSVRYAPAPPDRPPPPRCWRD